MKAPVIFNLIIFCLRLPTSTKQVCTCSCSALVTALQEQIRISPRWEISHLNCCENITLQGTVATSRDNEEDKIERSAFLRTPPLSSSSPYNLPSLYIPRCCTNYSPQARNIGCWHKPHAWYSTRCHWHILTRAIWTFLTVKCHSSRTRK